MVYRKRINLNCNHRRKTLIDVTQYGYGIFKCLSCGSIGSRPHLKSDPADVVWNLFVWNVPYTGKRKTCQHRGFTQVNFGEVGYRRGSQTCVRCLNCGLFGYQDPGSSACIWTIGPGAFPGKRPVGRSPKRMFDPLQVQNKGTEF